MQVTDDFSGKVVIVTGGGQGMGRAVAQRFIEGGAKVVVNDKNAVAAHRVTDALGGGALAAPGDVTVKADVDAIVRMAVDAFGSIDILVNNAGILFSTTLADMEEEEWDLVIDVNMKGTYLFTRAVLPHMKRSGWGRIVNFSSTAGKAVSTLGGPHYTAAKAGILGLTRAAAMEFAPYGITVNAVCPGLVDTENGAGERHCGAAGVVPRQLSDLSHLRSVRGGRARRIPRIRPRRVYHRRFPRHQRRRLDDLVAETRPRVDAELGWRAPDRAFMWYNHARIIPLEDNALMPTDDERGGIEAAISEIAEMSPQETDGKWLERLTVEAAPRIREWDIGDAWLWGDWPGRASEFPNSTKLDVGIDVVAVRRSDGAHIAIQCKSRKLDADGHGSDIGYAEISKFATAAGSEFWVENWLVTNGANELARGAAQAISMRGKPIKPVNITADLEAQRDSNNASDAEYCARCENPEDPDAVQAKSCMQREAISASVRLLRDHADSDSGGSPKGEARGRIILPCGTGKTRISLRIVEELTPSGEVSIVLCPSIALVAQIRKEYLQYAASPMDILAVCSDVTAGYDPKKEGLRNSAEDPTVDNSNVSADEVKGRVTTDADEIAEWMRQPALDPSSIKVLIGTYQSSARVSDALLSADRPGVCSHSG